MTPMCRLTRVLIVWRLDDGGSLPSPVRSHRDRCLACQASEARIRAAVRALPELVDTAPPPSELIRAHTKSGRPNWWWSPVAVGTALTVALLVRRRVGVPLGRV